MKLDRWLEVMKCLELEYNLRRNATAVECIRHGIKVYQGKLCVKCGHGFRRVGGFACLDCERDYSRVYRALCELVRDGLAVKLPGGGWTTTKEQK